MNIQSIVLIGALVGVAASIVTVIVIRPLGVGTWDGRNGSQSIGSSEKGLGWERDNMGMIEVHVTWIWRDWIINRNSLKHRTIQQGIHYLKKQKFDPNDSEEAKFWENLQLLGEKVDMLPEIVKSVRADDKLWKLRAYSDVDLAGNGYMALEISATVRWPPQFDLKEDVQTRDLTEEIAMDCIRDRERTDLTHNEKELLVLCRTNPGLKEWLGLPLKSPPESPPEN